MNLAVGQLAGMGALVMGAGFETFGLPLVAGSRSGSSSAAHWARSPAGSSPAPA